MVPSAPLLILALVALLLPLPAAAAPGCLRCHPVHYADRGSCTSCHGGNDKTGRKQVAHDRLISGEFAWSRIPGSPPVEQGKKLLDTLACRRCHTVGKKGNKLAGNLDTVPLVRQPEELADSIRYPVQQMPDFKLKEEDVSRLVTAVLAGTAAPRKEEPPVVVHFSREPKKEDLFQKKCGGCHSMLTDHKGGVGTGEVGPNLSGLLSEFYPRTFRDDSRWTVARLKEWVANPRKVRRLSTMQPVKLDEREWASVRKMFEEIRRGNGK